MNELFELFLRTYPEYLTHARTEHIDGRGELVVSTDCTVAFARWAADRGDIPGWKAARWERWVRAAGKGAGE